MSEQLPEPTEAPEPVETPAADAPSERIFPKDTASLVDDYFGAPAEARAVQEEQEQAEAVYQAGYDEALSDDAIYGDDDEEPAGLDLKEMTPGEIQAAIDSGDVTDHELHQFVAEGIQEEMAPYAEASARLAEERSQSQQRQNAEWQAQYAEGEQHLRRIVGQAHRRNDFGTLGQERSVPLAAAHTDEAVSRLAAEGWSAEQIGERSKEIIDWASETAAEETHRKLMGARILGLRTDTFRRERR